MLAPAAQGSKGDPAFLGERGVVGMEGLTKATRVFPDSHTSSMGLMTRGDNLATCFLQSFVVGGPGFLVEGLLAQALLAVNSSTHAHACAPLCFPVSADL